MKKVLIIATLLAGACASDQPRTTAIAVQDPVAVTKARIASEQAAGREAKTVCGELNLQSNRDCLEDIARARLKLDARTELPKFTNTTD